MEAQEAGIETWPQLPFRPHDLEAPDDSEDSSTVTYANDSRRRDPTPPVMQDSKAIRAEEKRKRKAERDAIRAAKAARRARREAIASAKMSHGRRGAEKSDRNGGDASISSPVFSTQDTEPISSFPDVSSSAPIDSDAVDQKDEEGDSASQRTSGSRGSMARSPSPLKDSFSTDKVETSLEDNTITSPRDPSEDTPYPTGGSRPKSSPNANGKKLAGYPTTPTTYGKGRSTTKGPGVSSTSAQKSKEREEPSSLATEAPKPKATPAEYRLAANAEAGPSTQKQDAAKPITVSKGKSASKKRAGTGSKEKKPEIDEALKSRLSDASAAQEFITSKWWNPPYLNALEAAGIVVLKKGKLEAREVSAIRRHFEIFMQTNRLDQEQMVEIIMSKKGRSNVREAYPSFWQDVASQIPGRPLRYVQKQVQRLYDPRGRKGAWTADEDRELKRAHGVHPGEWTKIAAIVDRTEQDCRDRWSKELANSESRHSGPWTTAEEDALQEAIAEANEFIGQDALSPDAPWEVVSAKMKYQRSSIQCRTKWRRELYPRLSGTGARLSMTPSSSQATGATPRKKRKTAPAEPTKASEGKHKRVKRSVSVVIQTKRPGKQYKSEDMIEDSGSDEEAMQEGTEDKKAFDDVEDEGDSEEEEEEQFEEA